MAKAATKKLRAAPTRKTQSITQIMANDKKQRDAFRKMIPHIGIIPAFEAVCQYAEESTSTGMRTLCKSVRKVLAAYP